MLSTAFLQKACEKQRKKQQQTESGRGGWCDTMATKFFEHNHMFFCCVLLLTLLLLFSSLISANKKEKFSRVSEQLSFSSAMHLAQVQEKRFILGAPACKTNVRAKTEILKHSFWGDFDNFKQPSTPQSANFICIKPLQSLHSAEVQWFFFNAESF